MGSNVEPSSSNTDNRAVRVAAFLDGLDRRWLYLALFLAVVISLLTTGGVEVKVTGPVKKHHAAIEKMERRPGHLVIVAMDFDPQTRAENYPQAVATVRHLFENKIPFAVLTLTAMGRGFCEDIPNGLAEEYGAVYGRDWVNWGYKPTYSIFVGALASDIQDAVKKDAYRALLTEIPVMRGVKDASSVDLVCEFTGSVGLLEMWLQFFQKGGVRPEFIHGCTAVSGPSNYTFLDSGQISGLLVGMLGAAEYEQMLGKPGLGLKGMTAQTAAHGLIIALIVVGNIAEIVCRRYSVRREGAS